MFESTRPASEQVLFQRTYSRLEIISL